MLEKSTDQEAGNGFFQITPIMLNKGPILGFVLL